MNHCSLLKGAHCAFLEPQPRPSPLIYREKFISIFISMNIFFLQWGENHKTGVWEGGAEGELGGDHQKGKLCTAGKKNHCVTPGEKYCCFA